MDNDFVFGCAFGINAPINTVMLKPKNNHIGIKSLMTLFGILFQTVYKFNKSRQIFLFFMYHKTFGMLHINAIIDIAIQKGVFTSI